MNASYVMDMEEGHIMVLSYHANSAMALALPEKEKIIEAWINEKNNIKAIICWKRAEILFITATLMKKLRNFMTQ